MNRRRSTPSIHLDEPQQRSNVGLKGLLASFVPKKLLYSVSESTKGRTGGGRREKEDVGRVEHGNTCVGASPGRKKEQDLDFSGMGLKSSKGLTLFCNVKKPEAVERVCLDHNRFETLPEDLSRCLQLRVLSTTDNDLNTVPHWIASLIALTELDLRKNSIQSLPESFKCLKRLSFLNLSFNPLTSIDHSLVHCSNLTWLNLNDCCLQFLPATIGRLHHLRSLELRNNSLQALPVGMGRLGRLEFLDVGGNRLTHLPETVGNLSNLKVFLVDENRLTSLPQNLDGLERLELFDICSNELRELTPSMGKLCSIETLLLVDNRLTNLPDAICNLANLKLLRVDRNGLRQLPVNFGRLHVKEFSACGNELLELPVSFCGLKHLQVLFLDRNGLRTLPLQFGDLHNLCVVSLCGNNMETLPASMGNLFRLITLDLRDNHLQSLPASMRELNSLRALWLSHNQATPKLSLTCEFDSATGQKVLSCYLLPQQNQSNDPMRHYVSLKKAGRNGQLNKCKRITFEAQNLSMKDISTDNIPSPHNVTAIGHSDKSHFQISACSSTASRTLEMLSSQHEVAVKVETSFGSLVRQSKTIRPGKISPRLLYQLDKIKNEQWRSMMFQTMALTVVRNRLDFNSTNVSDNNKPKLCRPPSLIRPYAMIDLKTLQAQVEAERRRSSVPSFQNGAGKLESTTSSSSMSSFSANSHEYEAIFDYRKKKNLSNVSKNDFQYMRQQRACSRYDSCTMRTVAEEGQKHCNRLDGSI